MHTRCIFSVLIYKAHNKKVSRVSSNFLFFTLSCSFLLRLYNEKWLFNDMSLWTKYLPFCIFKLYPTKKFVIFISPCRKARFTPINNSCYTYNPNTMWYEAQFCTSHEEGVQHQKYVSDFVHIRSICYLYDTHIKYAVFFNKVEKAYDLIWFLEQKSTGR